MRGGDPTLLLLLRWQSPKAGLVLALLGRDRGCRCRARTTAPPWPRAAHVCAQMEEEAACPWDARYWGASLQGASRCR